MNAPDLPDDELSLKGTRDWPHAPPHRLGGAGVYFVTVRTLEKRRHFHTPERLTWVRDHLLELAAHYNWRMEAWAVLSNHYHIVAHSPAEEANAESLRRWLKHFHADVSRHINRLDGVEGRQLWHNFRETHLTFQRSYPARLNYTHCNAVHHRLVARASDYPWCSAAAFEKAVSPAWAKTIGSFQYDEIAKEDEDGEDMSGAKPLWSAGTCSSFTEADLSALRDGTEDVPNGETSGCGGGLGTLDGDKSPAESSNKLEQSKAPAAPFPMQRGALCGRMNLNQH